MIVQMCTLAFKCVCVIFIIIIIIIIIAGEHEIVFIEYVSSSR